MRTIDAAWAFIAEADEATSLTKTALRRLCASGRLPTVRIGMKYLIDLDTLEAFLCGQAAR
jgi:excisionase family DNA binding protein